MALKEGRCPNCGSILHLDPASEKGHCLFCDAVFVSQDAFNIAANPKDVLFPNLPQPKYEGPSLDPRSIVSASQAAQRVKQQQQPAAKKPAADAAKPPAYVAKDAVTMPSFKLSTQTKLRAFLVLVLVLAIIAVIAVPTIMNRDAARLKLLEAMPSLSPFEVDASQDVSIGRAGNRYLLIVAGENVTEADAVTLFKAFSLKRAEIQGADPADESIYRQVTVKIVMPGGGWLIDRPAGLAELDSGSAVVALNP
jgi:hypothetical protein